MSFTDSLPFVWPLAFILVSLFILRRVGDDMRPIVNGVVGGVAKNAQQHALMYALRIDCQPSGTKRSGDILPLGLHRGVCQGCSAWPRRRDSLRHEAAESTRYSSFIW